MKKILTSALAGAAAVIVLSGCAEQDPPKELQVELEDGRKASCIVVEDSETGDVEEMVCNWPDDQPTAKKDK